MKTGLTTTSAGLAFIGLAVVVVVGLVITGIAAKALAINGERTLDGLAPRMALTRRRGLASRVGLALGTALVSEAGKGEARAGDARMNMGEASWARAWSK